MKTEEFKEILLQVLEFQLEYQLRALRQLRGKARTEADSSIQTRKKTSVLGRSICSNTD